MVSIIVIDEYLLVPLFDFNFHISNVNVLETELWAEGLYSASHCMQNTECERREVM